LALCAMAVGACDSLLEVEMPGQMTEDQLLQPQMAEMMVTGAIAGFECAHVSHILGAAGITHEYLDASGWTTWMAFANRQIEASEGAVNTSGCSGERGFGIFRPLQTARFQAEQAYEAIRDFGVSAVPDGEALLATAATYAAYAYTFLGESWCEMVVDGGPLMTPVETLREAERWFTLAIGHAETVGSPIAAPGTSDVALLATLGRARVRLDLGDLAGATADAAQIPEGFLAVSTRSGANDDRRNMIFVHMTLNKFVTVGPSYRNLAVGEEADPRVAVSASPSGVTNDGFTPWWNQLKYGSDVEDVPLARWAEAQLILAEAAGGAAAVPYIDAVRAQHDLPGYSGGTSPEEMRAALIEERRREFFLEGRRHADMLRYGVPFATGVGHKGTPYGSTTCYPLAQAELDGNPNL
jgi:starch-binding outer membrane protein, SusD/RagB family